MNVQIYLKNQIHTNIQLLKNNTRGHTMKNLIKINNNEINYTKEHIDIPYIKHNLS